MSELQVKGVHGSELTVDSEGVTFHAKGALAKGALGTGERRIAFGEITDRSFKAANIAVNGHIEVADANGKSIFHFMTGRAARSAKEAFDLIVLRTPNAGIDTAARGLTTKAGVEGAASLSEALSDLGEVLAAAKADLAEALAAMREVNLTTLFPGLRFDADTATYQGVTQPIAGSTAVVESAGALTRRPTLSRVAMGGLLGGAVGAIAGGLLQKKDDGRQVFILIDGTKAAWVVPVKPDQVGEATRFAALFNTASKEAAALAAQDSNVAAPAIGLAEQLKSLADLHAQGLLTADEFSTAKAALLQEK